MTATQRHARVFALFSACGLGLAALLVASCAKAPKDPGVDTMDPLPNGGMAGEDDGSLSPGSYTRHTVRGEGSDTHPELHTDPTGTWLYFATDRDGKGYNIARKLIGGGSAIEMVTSAKGDELWPRVSPSGRYLAYGSNQMGNWDIYVMDLYRRDAAPVRVTQSAAHDIHPTWAPDGRRIVYASESTTERDFILSYVDLVASGEGGLGAETPIARKANASYRSAGPMLISDGLAELPGNRAGASDGGAGSAGGLVRVTSRGSLMTAEGAVVTGMHPDYRPGNENRHELVFQDFRKSGESWNSLKLFNMRNGLVRIIPISEGFGAIQPRWSPSGEQIVFATVGKRAAGTTNTLAHIGAEGFAVTTPDGQAVSDLKNPTVSDTVSSPMWAKFAGETHLFFATRAASGKGEFIASIKLADR